MSWRPTLGSAALRRPGVTMTLRLSAGTLETRYPKLEVAMASGMSIIRNDITVHREGKVPVFKVAGFDGYDFASLGVTDQFLDNSAVYFEKYTNPSHFRDLYRHALGKLRLREGELTVLDIGTGGGNSIFALFELLGPDRLKALGVDISPQLLEMCSQAADAYGLGDESLELLCADLYDLNIEPESVDLVAGSSILHHMIDPAPIVQLTLSALKSGGSAIFTEPFEDGSGLLVNAYSNILALEIEQAEKLPNDLRLFMQQVKNDFDARKGIGNVRDYTGHLDDKWYFTRGWFDDLARQAGCSMQIVPSHGGGDHMFWKQFMICAKLHNGADGNNLPKWAEGIFRRLDETFSLVQKRDFMFTGIVVLTKDS